MIECPAKQLGICLLDPEVSPASAVLCVGFTLSGQVAEARKHDCFVSEALLVRVAHLWEMQLWVGVVVVLLASSLLCPFVRVFAT